MVAYHLLFGSRHLKHGCSPYPLENSTYSRHWKMQGHNLLVKLTCWECTLEQVEELFCMGRLSETQTPQMHEQMACSALQRRGCILYRRTLRRTCYAQNLSIGKRKKKNPPPFMRCQEFIGCVIEITQRKRKKNTKKKETGKKKEHNFRGKSQ